MNIWIINISMKWIITFLLAILMLTSGQAVSQKLLASQEQPESFLQAYETKCSDYGCFYAYRGDGVCDKVCNNKLCNYDDGDCASSS